MFHLGIPRPIITSLFSLLSQGPNTSINVPVVKVHENLISLLLKLHSNLSGVPDSFVLEKELAKGDINDRAAIGDGPFYVGKLLKRLALADDNCKQGIGTI